MKHTKIKVYIYFSLLLLYSSSRLVNYGCLLLEALLRNCPFVHPTQSGSGGGGGNDGGMNIIKINDHIPIIFSEIAGRTLYRVEYKDVGKESEQQSLTNVLPIWIIDPLTNVRAARLFSSLSSLCLFI